MLSLASAAAIEAIEANVEASRVILNAWISVVESK